MIQSLFSSLVVVSRYQVLLLFSVILFGLSAQHKDYDSVSVAGSLSSVFPFPLLAQGCLETVYLLLTSFVSPLPLSVDLVFACPISILAKLEDMQIPSALFSQGLFLKSL